MLQLSAISVQCFFETCWTKQKISTLWCSFGRYVSHSELFAFFKVGKTYLRTMKTSDGGYAIELKEALAGGSSVTIEIDSVMDGLLKYDHQKYFFEKPPRDLPGESINDS